MSFDVLDVASFTTVVFVYISVVFYVLIYSVFLVPRIAFVEDFVVPCADGTVMI